MSSPYATGGGGVVLEHAYAGSLLAYLLLGRPVAGLGDEFVPVEVGLQRGADAPVDDLVVTGRTRYEERTLRIACRRRPVYGRSDASTVGLFADYLSVVIDNAITLESGSLRAGFGRRESTRSFGTAG